MANRLKFWIPIIVALIISITVASISAEESLIPSWIKNTAKFWVEGQVSDSAFVNALQYLITKDIIQVPMEEDPRIKELEDKNKALKLKLTSLEEQIQSESKESEESFCEIELKILREVPGYEISSECITDLLVKITSIEETRTTASGFECKFMPVTNVEVIGNPTLSYSWEIIGYSAEMTPASSSNLDTDHPTLIFQRNVAPGKETTATIAVIIDDGFHELVKTEKLICN